MKPPLPVRLIVSVDPTHGVELCPPDSEWAAARPALLLAVAQQRLAVSTLVQLLMAQCVQAFREVPDRAGPAIVSRRVPVWPPCLAEAAGLPGEALDELECLLPDVTLVLGDQQSAVVAGWVGRELGLPGLDLAAYSGAVARRVQVQGWASIQQPTATDGSSSASCPGCATAAGLLMDPTGRVLLEKRADDAAVSPGLWDTPGGHIESGEQPAQTLLRELQEELAVRPAKFALLLVRDEWERASGKLYRHFVYRVHEWRGQVNSREGQQLAWFTLAEALALPALHPIAREGLELSR